MTKEIWHSVVTTICPSCKFKSPGIKRDGYTKLFTKPLAAKHLLVNAQRNRVSSAQPHDNDGGLSDFGTEGKTNTSSKNGRTAAESIDIRERENPEEESEEDSDEESIVNEIKSTK